MKVLVAAVVLLCATGAMAQESGNFGSVSPSPDGVASASPDTGPGPSNAQVSAYNDAVQSMMDSLPSLSVPDGPQSPAPAGCCHAPEPNPPSESRD